jgi:1-pyrroline-5-carboxylate dehydrogenase
MSAVIDKNSFDNIKSYIDWAKASDKCEILVGGKCSEYNVQLITHSSTGDDSKGYFVEPTIILVKDPAAKVIQEEIFGPVLSVYVYPADQYEQTVRYSLFIYN